MSSILTAIVQLLTGGLSQMASGIGTGLKEFIENIFVVVTPGTGGAADTYALTTFASVCVIFAGVSLAIGLSRWVLNFVTSLGARNR